MYFDLSNPIELIISKKAIQIVSVLRDDDAKSMRPLPNLRYYLSSARIWTPGVICIWVLRAGKSTNNWICIAVCVLRLHKISFKFDYYPSYTQTPKPKQKRKFTVSSVISFVLLIKNDDSPICSDTLLLYIYFFKTVHSRSRLTRMIWPVSNAVALISQL